MKENVLEVKVVKMNDKYSFLTITKQDDTLIERGKFMFKATNDVEISSSYVPQHGYSHDAQRNKNNSFLFIGGVRIEEDYTCLIISNKKIPLITEAIKELNEKYGKPKLWRAEKDKEYYFVSQNGSVINFIDDRYTTDNKLYNSGNYFRTQEQAEECKKRIAKVIDDYHKEIGE